MDDQEKEEPVTPYMDVYKKTIQSVGSLDRLKLRTVVKIDQKIKENIGDIRYTTSSMRAKNYFLVDDSKHKSRVHQLYFIEAFLQANVEHRFFVQLNSRYGE